MNESDALRRFSPVLLFVCLFSREVLHTSCSSQFAAHLSKLLISERCVAVIQSDRSRLSFYMHNLFICKLTSRNSAEIIVNDNATISLQMSEMC